MSPTWKSKRPFAVLPLLTLLSGCGASVSGYTPPPVIRQLPAAPSTCATVPLPIIPDKLVADKRTMALLYDHRAGLATADRRLSATCNWYGSVREEYSK
jgi:hypothetical protein